MDIKDKVIATQDILINQLLESKRDLIQRQDTARIKTVIENLLEYAGGPCPTQEVGICMHCHSIERAKALLRIL